MHFQIVLLIALIGLSAFRAKLPGVDLKWAWLAWLGGQAWKAAFVLIPTVDALTQHRYRMKTVEEFGVQFSVLACAGLIAWALFKEEGKKGDS